MIFHICYGYGMSFRDCCRLYIYFSELNAVPMDSRHSHWFLCISIFSLCLMNILVNFIIFQWFLYVSLYNMNFLCILNILIDLNGFEWLLECLIIICMNFITFILCVHIFQKHYQVFMNCKLSYWFLCIWLFLHVPWM